MVSTETVGLITASGVKVLALSAWASLKPPMSYYSFIRVEVKVPHSACADRAGVTIFFSVVFAWSKTVIGYMFSDLPGCFFPVPLPRENRFLLEYYFVYPIGVYRLPGSSAPF